MSQTRAPSRAFSRIPFLPGALATRPKLVTAIGAGLVIAIGFVLVPNALRWSTRAILAWDVFCAVFFLTIMPMMRCSDTETMKNRAETQDEGQGVILGLVIVASAAAIAAIAAELSAAKMDHGMLKVLRVALAFGTVAASWLFVHLIFALHYAHEFYAPKDEDPSLTQGGLSFPGEETPDYWDFLHFAVIIGVAAQTADVAFTSHELRRIGTVHGVVAFTFNTVVLALTINLVAGLF